MKSKGFTLIELLISLSITLIIIGFGISTLKYEKHFIERREAEVFQVSLLNFLNNCKANCKNNNIGGEIVFEDERKQVYFHHNSTSVYVLNAPKTITEMYLYGRKSIYIDNRGYTSDACTIRFKDGTGKEHAISICVGSSYANIKY